MAYFTERIHILAQPKASYRERYWSETKKSGNLVQRFIRADPNVLGFEYPAIKIPSDWIHLDRPVYIRVTSVTLPTDSESIVCIHPYPIDTEDSNVIRDQENNTLYFPVTNDDILRGFKSFRLTRKKILQSELKHYGSLRILDSSRRHSPRMTSKSRGKEFIKVYSLWKSQLTFCVAELIEGMSFKAHLSSIVFTQVMSDEMYQPKEDDETMFPDPITDGDNQYAICTPEQGRWEGGDNILMVLPKLDRRKPFRVFLDYGDLKEKGFIQYELVDVKTILFKTPACLLSPNGENVKVPIVTVQDERVIGKFDFLYLAQHSSFSTTMQLSSFLSDNSPDTISSILNSDLSSPNFDDWFTDPQYDWS